MCGNYNYRKMINSFLSLMIAIMLLAGCQSKALVHKEEMMLEPVAFSDAQWTGLAIADDGRLFVNYSRWSDNVPVSVAQLVNGNPAPFPNIIMNSWEPGKDPAKYLVPLSEYTVLIPRLRPRKVT